MPGEQIFTGDLRKQDFSRQQLPGAIFFGADLYQASFEQANLESAVIVNCFAAEANFSQAHCVLLLARQTSFFRANFRGANLSEALLWNCVLAGADLTGAELRQLTLTLDCNSFEDVRLDHSVSAEMAYLFSRTRSPQRDWWLKAVGERDLSRLERLFAP